MPRTHQSAERQHYTHLKSGPEELSCQLVCGLLLRIHRDYTAPRNSGKLLQTLSYTWRFWTCPWVDTSTSFHASPRHNKRVAVLIWFGELQCRRAVFVKTTYVGRKIVHSVHVLCLYEGQSTTTLTCLTFELFCRVFSRAFSFEALTWVLYGHRKLRRTLLAKFLSIVLHARSSWEQNVAEKAWKLLYSKFFHSSHDMEQTFAKYFRPKAIVRKLRGGTSANQRQAPTPPTH